MGRRAKKAPVQTKKRPTLAKKFKCPFCAHQDAVECKMDFKSSSGRVECRMCGSFFQMKINHLTEPIDVFSEWLDACEHAQSAVDPRPTSGGAAVSSSSITQPQYQEDSDDDDDDDLGRPSGLSGSGAGASAAGSSGGGAAAKSSSGATGGSSGKSPSVGTGAAQRTTHDLGLDDSDDDSD